MAARATSKRKLWQAPRDRRRPLARGVAVALALAVAGCATTTTIVAPKRVALVYRDQRGDAVLAAPDGAHARTLGAATQALLSPDGARVAALIDHGAQATLTLYATGRTARTSALTQLGPPHWAALGTQLLAWSPDSAFVALTTDVVSASGEQGVLLVVNAASGHVTTIATGEFLGASFAPSLPDRLVYARASVEQLDDNESLLYVTDPNGRHTRELTHAGLASAPAWSMRGIVFAKLLALGTSDTSPRYGLALVQPSGGGLHAIGDFDSGPPAADAAGAAIRASASGARLLADFYSPYSRSPLVDVWTLNLAARHPRAQVLRQPGAHLVGDAVARNGKTVLVTAIPDSGKPEQVESLPWNGGSPRVLAPAASEPTWNH